MAASSEHKALLKQAADDYIASMGASKGLNFNQVGSDRLLIIEALNDWSGRMLAEGGSIKLSYGCDDPACASSFEVAELIRRVHAPPVLLYPVSGFSLSDTGGLKFSFTESAFQMVPHVFGSQSDAIAIAEASRIRDVDAAMGLWSLCATEDCLAYLQYQMNEHGLYFGDEEETSTRQIIASALLTTFSVGQIWNAIWRSVRDAAALSTKQYYNVPKASKTIPKKIDKVLTQYAGAGADFQAYERLATLPMGAVPTLLLSRFSIHDHTTGPEVRAKFLADAQLAQPAAPESDADRVRVDGTMFFIGQFTQLDRMVLSSFHNLQSDMTEPEWDADQHIGRIYYRLDDIYAFDGAVFLRKFLAANGVPEPTNEDFSRHAAAAKERAETTGRWVDPSGHYEAIEEALIKAGVSSKYLDHVCSAVSFPASPETVMQMMDCLPGERGLRAIRAGTVHLSDEFTEQSNRLHTGTWTFDFAEELLEPISSDTDLVRAVAEENIDRLADLVATSIRNSVLTYRQDFKDKLLQQVAQRLLNNTAQGIPAENTTD